MRGQWVEHCPLAGFGIALVAEARASSARLSRLYTIYHPGKNVIVCGIAAG